MGKSYFIRDEEKRLRAALNNGPDKSILQDLAGSESSDEVRRRMFETNTYRAWKTGKHRLTLFVDSVDQAVISTEHVVTAIANELADADLSRLQLRLVCRDHAWSVTLADTLRYAWRNLHGADEVVRVYQLAPLGLAEIRFAAAANTNTIEDPDQFIQEVKDADALPLARVPITLEMLLKAPEYLTSSKDELYKHGLKRLCRGKEAKTDLSTIELERRFQFASRIAATMMLSRKHSIDVEADNVFELSSALAVSDLVSEVADENDESLIRATLNTALFHGISMRIWAHQSFAEYLAAHCLSDEGIPVEEIVRKTIAPDKKFASHLRDTLRWLIQMRTDILDEIIKRQPTLVLTTDLSRLNDKEFRKLFKAILNLDDPYVYSHETWNLRNFRASHSSAKSVLLPYLGDTSLSMYLRRFVLDLVECFDIREIDDALVQLALDKTEDQVIRCLAARRLADVGSDDAKLRLKPYICGREDDLEDELKGYALQALWPHHLTADELFNALKPPKRENYLGSYRAFLFEDSIVDKLRAVDLPVALKWVAAQPSLHEALFSLRDLPVKIMRKAWDNIDAPGVMDAFAQTVVTRMSRFDGLFNEPPYSYPHNRALDEIEQDFTMKVDKRRKIVLNCLKYMTEKDIKPFSLLHCWPPLVVADDMDWLLGLLDAEADGVLRHQLAQLVTGLFRNLDAQDDTISERYRNIDKVYEASERHPDLMDLTRQFFYLALDDPVAVSRRNHHRAMKESEEKRDRHLAEVRPFEKLEKALDRIKVGETWQWHNVIYSLSHSPDGRGDSLDFKPDLTNFPLWKSCDKETRERIVQAALSFISAQKDVISDNNDDWYQTGSVPYVELYGYLAISLLQKAHIEAIERWGNDEWQRWSKIIVWYPFMPMYLSDGRTDYLNQTICLQKGILQCLYQYAPQATLDDFSNLLVAQDKSSSSVGQVLEKLENLWNPAFETMLLGFLQAASLSPQGQRSILDFLMTKDSAEAIRIAEAQIASGYSDENEKDLIVEFSASLMLSESEFNWAVVWRLFLNHNDIGQAIVQKVADADRRAEKFLSKLGAPELVDLFIWMEKRYPTCEDPQNDGIHVVTPREQVGNWRNSIIQELRKKDNREALDGIRRILCQFAHLEWLHFVRLELEEALEGSDWNPSSPYEIVQLVPLDHERRFSALRQWFRENQAEVTTAGVFIATVSLFVAVCGIILTISGSHSQRSVRLDDSQEATLTETSGHPSGIADNIASMTPDNVSNVAEIKETDASYQEIMVSPHFGPSNLENIRPSVTEDAPQHLVSPAFPLAAAEN